MGRHQSLSWFLFGFFFILLGILGCSTTNSLTRKISLGKPVLKKRVMILPFIDQAGIGPEETSRMTASFIDQLRKSSHIIIHPSNPSFAQPQDPRSPQFGIVIQPELIRMAEESNLNALITGILAPVEITTKKGGIWPFRSMNRHFETSVIVNAVDVATGTLILTSLKSKQEKVPLDDFFDAMETEIEPETVKQIASELLPSIMSQQASVVSSTLGEEPWYGKVLSVEENSLVVNAGSEVGVQPGHRFEVFGMGEPVRSRSGAVFHSLGKKIGEVKVASTTNDRSVCTLPENSSFQTGQIVRSVN